MYGIRYFSLGTIDSLKHLFAEKNTVLLDDTDFYRHCHFIFFDKKENVSVIEKEPFWLNSFSATKNTH